MILKRLKTLILAAAVFVSCSASINYAALKSELNDYIRQQDARIGIAVIINGNDTVDIHGNEDFPMLSVYKFPIALALADYYRSNELDFDQPIAVTQEGLHADTYSPMTDSILRGCDPVPDTLWISARSILNYMLQQSDNNASDIAVKQLGGTQKVMDYLNAMGAPGINVVSTEAQMHDNINLCYLNSSSPLAMARLMERFLKHGNDPLSMEIKQMLQSCTTGANRLALPLKTKNITIGHKTGTGFPLPDGGIMAVNDAGYVLLPDGRSYTIVVFIADSHNTLDRTETMIAHISELVLRHLESGRTL